MCCPHMWHQAVPHKLCQKRRGLVSNWSSHSNPPMFLSCLLPQQCVTDAPAGDPNLRWPNFPQCKSLLAPWIRRIIAPLSICIAVDPLALSCQYWSVCISITAYWWYPYLLLLCFRDWKSPSPRLPGILQRKCIFHTHPLIFVIQSWKQLVLWLYNLNE